MNWPIILTIPIITGLIGWMTNHVAVKMLFRPRNPVIIFGFNWQGLVPRRQAEVAAKAAEVIENEILERHILKEKIGLIDIRPLIDDFALRIVWDRLGPQLKEIPLVGRFVNDSVMYSLHQAVSRELRNESGTIVDTFAEEAEKQLNIREMIEERICGFDLDHLEKVIYSLAAKEFRNIEILGGVLGFLVGLVQLGLLWAMGSIHL